MTQRLLMSPANLERRQRRSLQEIYVWTVTGPRKRPAAHLNPGGGEMRIAISAQTAVTRWIPAARGGCDAMKGKAQRD